MQACPKTYWPRATRLVRVVNAASNCGSCDLLINLSTQMAYLYVQRVILNVCFVNFGVDTNKVITSLLLG